MQVRDLRVFDGQTEAVIGDAQQTISFNDTALRGSKPIRLTVTALRGQAVWWRGVKVSRAHSGRTAAVTCEQ